MRGVGRVLFVAILLLIAGTLNIIYGIAAVGNAHFFNGTQYVFSSLHTWGWITIIVGIIELAAGFSLMAGRTFGRVIAIIAATIGALESLLSIGGTQPVVVAGDLRALRVHPARPRRLRRGKAGAHLASPHVVGSLAGWGRLPTVCLQFPEAVTGADAERRVCARA